MNIKLKNDYLLQTYFACNIYLQNPILLKLKNIIDLTIPG